MFHMGKTQGLGLAWRICVGSLLALALWGCTTVVEEMEPERETTLVVTRSEGAATISWVARPGCYYSLMCADQRGARARWQLMPNAMNLRGNDGETLIVHDKVPVSRERYYRVNVSGQPLVGSP